MANTASKPTRGRARSQCLETRVTAEQKMLIERAAALEGRTVTDFVLTSIQDELGARSKSISNSNYLSATAGVR